MPALTSGIGIFQYENVIPSRSETPFVNKLCNSGIKDGKNIFYMQSFKLGDDHVAAIQRKCLFIIISKDKLAADKTITKAFLAHGTFL
mgnify:CR=1 FL=1